MIVVCSYCSTTIGKKPGLSVDKAGLELVSHGVCPPCSARVHRELDELFAREDVELELARLVQEIS